MSAAKSASNNSSASTDAQSAADTAAANQEMPVPKIKVCNLRDFLHLHYLTYC